jgi:prevent-host-death family protein
MRVTSTEFQQNIGRYQDAAQQAPVVITKNARPHTVLVSASFFKMVTEGRIARAVEELDEDTLNSIARSAVAAEYAALDNLIKDWTP